MSSFLSAIPGVKSLLYVSDSQAALHLGIGENPLHVRLGAGSPKPLPRRDADADTTGISLPLHVYVPARAVTFVPAEEGTEARKLEW